MQINKAAREAEVLGTLALAAPKTTDFQFVKVRVEGEVARLTLDRPEHNLLNERMLCELAAGINSSARRSEIKLIVLDSAAKTFCGGIELGEYTQRRVFQLLDAFHSAFSAMLDTSKPLLVVVNGPAFGGGAELAALGDLVIATPKARFAQPEIKLGVFPAAGRGDSSLYSGTEAGARACADRRNDVRRTRARAGPGELAGAGKRAAEESGRSDREGDGAVRARC